MHWRLCPPLLRRSSLSRCSSRTLLPLFALMLLAGCQTAPPKPVDTQPQHVDPTPPELRMTTGGLTRNMKITAKAKGPESRRVSSKDEVLFVATGTDAETGVRSVHILGESQVTCNPGGGRKNLVRVEPIDEQVDADPSRLPALPIQLTQQYRLVIGTEREKCGKAQFVDMRLEIHAETENGDGQISKLQPAILHFFGPDQFQVGTFDVQGDRNYADPQYLLWGATLGRMADVLLLTEVPDKRHVDLIAATAGMPYIAMGDPGTKVAIASRTPLRNVQVRKVDPAGVLDNDSYLISAVTDLDGYPHRFIATFWSKLDANDEYYGPARSSPGRQQAAEMVLQQVTPNPEVTVVGGTLNAYSGIGPQLAAQTSTAELDLVRAKLTDVFSVLQLPNTAHCSQERIDYLFVSGPVVPKSYQACFAEAAPSEHPFVLVTVGVE